MYPLKFDNIYYEKIWGGMDLEQFRKNLPEGLIGESWDIACHENGTGVVSNGGLKGKALSEIFDHYKLEVIGTEIRTDRFPLLLKFINASEPLSVQVHPSDEYGMRVENDFGKTEAWYVQSAKEGAYLILGTKGTDSEAFKEALRTEKDLGPYLNKVKVKEGDVFFIHSGLIHAIGPGLVIYEIQQNSDTTYRVYDYGRPRELNIEKSLEVMDFTLGADLKTGVKRHIPGGMKTNLILNEYFSLEKYEVDGLVREYSDPGRFFLFTVVNGDGEILYKEGAEILSKGDSLLIPASLGEFSLKGKFDLLKAYVPDLKKVKEEILQEIL